MAERRVSSVDWSRGSGTAFNTWFSPSPGEFLLQQLAHRHSVRAALRGDGLIRLVRTSLAEQVQYAPGDDAVEEPLAVDIRWKHGLRARAQRAEEVIHLAVLRADRSLQVFLQRAAQRRRLAAGGDGDLDAVLVDDGRDDELAEGRDVDDVDRNAAGPAGGGGLLVYALMVGRGDDDVRPVQIARFVQLTADLEAAFARPLLNLIGELGRDDPDLFSLFHHRLRLARADASATDDEDIAPFDVEVDGVVR